MRATIRAEEFMVDDIERLIDITRWPRWLRRAFVLALPVTGPAYIAFFFMLICIAIVWMIGAWLFDLWK